MENTNMKAPLVVYAHNRRFLDWMRKNSYDFNDEEGNCILANAKLIVNQFRENGLSTKLVLETLKLAELLALENRLHNYTDEENDAAVAMALAKDAAKEAEQATAKAKETAEIAAAKIAGLQSKN